MSNHKWDIYIISLSFRDHHEEEQEGGHQRSERTGLKLELLGMTGVLGS